MKNRSNGMPMPNPQDDWGDGSWTVDCVCGVNFDDGEEMVNCDDCGVWVHTRCVRYVKSEKLFACDKCKSKNSRNDSKETEVAQLLVELPTKTLSMDARFNSSLPSQRPFRLWTELPMEDRVHVHGVPGGDPALFSGISSIFSPQLWKCTGYVPKKFNFQYREFPGWDTESNAGDDKQGSQSNGTTTDNGAGVLLSLSKECDMPAPVSNSDTIRSDSKDAKRSEPLSLKPTKSSDVSINLHANMKKDTGSVHRIMIHTGKRKKEECGTSKDHGGKLRKKAQINGKEGDNKKKDTHIRTAACKLVIGEKELQYSEDRGTKVINADAHRRSSGSLEGAVPSDHLAEGTKKLDTDTGNCKITLNSSEQHSKMTSFDVPKQNSSSETLPQEQCENQVAPKIQNSPRGKDGIAASSLEHSESASVPIKEEDAGGGREVTTIAAKIELQNSEPVKATIVSDDPEVKSLQNCRDLIVDVTCSSVPETKAKADGVHSSSPRDAMLERTKSVSHHADTSNILSYESAKGNDVPVVNAEDRDHKGQDVDSSVTVGNNKIKNSDRLPHDLCQSNQESTVAEDDEKAQNSSSGLKHGKKLAEDLAKPSAKTSSTATVPSQRKVILTMGKSSSTLVPKAPASESCISSNAHNQDINSLQRGVSDSNLSSKRDAASFSAVRDEEGNEKTKKMVKEFPKSSVGSASKAHMTKITYTSSKRTLSDSKDSRTAPMRNASGHSVSGESSSSMQSEGASSAQNKPTVTAIHHKGEKANQSGSQPSVKVSGAPTLSSSTVGLSDEELALLLHQQLNSSPRVPRVPRMRHAGSLPTINSPAGTSTLMKRTSSGGKDHGLTSRRRKDSGKDGSTSSRERVDEAKKRDRLNSPDYRREDTHTKREADVGSSKNGLSLKKTNPSSSTAAGSNAFPNSHETKEPKLSSSHSSQRNAAGEDSRVAGRPSPRTLPGLIAEIMSKGERMTYEELCNAVLPHWPHLRKHNGERYAYSSHSQAVLDCLRNRSEWARLVDRGPKTSTSRKKRKHDHDSNSNEYEDNEDGSGRDRSGKEVGSSKSFESHQEEYPKGKRKARKRRRLVLHGRGIKDVRRRHRAGVISDDDDDEDDESESFSNSSDDSMFSEDEAVGAATSPATKEASGSSDDRTTS